MVEVVVEQRSRVVNVPFTDQRTRLRHPELCKTCDVVSQFGGISRFDRAASVGNIRW